VAEDRAELVGTADAALEVQQALSHVVDSGPFGQDREDGQRRSVYRPARLRRHLRYLRALPTHAQTRFRQGLSL
jgi:hypothetical protein